MTTTAAAWRHVERLGQGELCAVPVEARGYDHRIPCACTTPTPDPDSPCGQRDHPKGLPCGAVASDGWHDRRTWQHDPELWHPHHPTRCLACGHALEAVR